MELTAANSSHGQAGQNESTLWRGAGRVQTRSGQETAGTALSQGHEGMRKAKPERIQCVLAHGQKGRRPSAFQSKVASFRVGVGAVLSVGPRLIFTKDLKKRPLNLSLIR